MGHVLLGTLPRTRRWQEVLEFILSKASVGQVAQASLLALQRTLLNLHEDFGVSESVWLLFQLPKLARQSDFVSALQKNHISVHQPPNICELVLAVSQSLHGKLSNNPRFTDLGEIAQNTLSQTLTSVLTQKTNNLFDVTANEVQEALASFATVKGYGLLAKSFFGRFLSTYIDSYLNRALPKLIGEGNRFTTITQQAEFAKALQLHFQESTEIINRFAGEWESKTRFEQGKIRREDVRDFIYGAVRKLLKEFHMRADPYAQ